MAQLKEEMSRGQISAEMLSQAFRWATEEGSLFYQGAEKAGQTLSGRWNRLKDSLSETAISLYGAIEPILSPVIGIATTLIETIGGGIGFVVDRLREGNPIIMAIAGVIGTITTALIAYNAVISITKLIQNGLTGAVWASNFAFLANPVFWVITGIVALIAVIVFLCLKVKGWGTLCQTEALFHRPAYGCH